MTQKKTEIRTILKRIEEAQNPAVKRLWSSLLKKEYDKGTPLLKQYVDTLIESQVDLIEGGRRKRKALNNFYH